MHLCQLKAVAPNAAVDTAVFGAKACICVALKVLAADRCIWSKSMCLCLSEVLAADRAVFRAEECHCFALRFWLLAAVFGAKVRTTSGSIVVSHSFKTARLLFWNKIVSESKPL